MAQLIPIPVEVAFRCGSREYGKIRLVPYATSRNGPLEVDHWRIVETDDMASLSERLLVEIFPRKLLCKICRDTFEEVAPDGTDKTISIVLVIDDEEWSYEVRARELEYEEVHYEIEIAGLWYRMTDTYARDLLLDDDHLMIAERAVAPSIDFGHNESVYEQMS